MIKWFNDPKNETKASWLMVIVPLAYGALCGWAGYGPLEMIGVILTGPNAY